MDFLSGKKTFITAGIGAITYGLFLAGVINRETLEVILMGLGIPAVAFLRSAISQPVKVELTPETSTARGLLSQPSPPEYVARKVK